MKAAQRIICGSGMLSLLAILMTGCVIHPWPADAAIAPGLKLYVPPEDLPGRLVFTERSDGKEGTMLMPFKVWEYDFAKNETRLVCRAPRNGFVDVYKSVYCVWDPVKTHYEWYNVTPDQRLAYVYDAETGEGVEVEFPDAIRTLYVMDGAICALVGDESLERLYVYCPSSRELRRIVMLEEEEQCRYDKNQIDGVGFTSPYDELVCDRAADPTRLYVYYRGWYGVHRGWSVSGKYFEIQDLPDQGWYSYDLSLQEFEWESLEYLDLSDARVRAIGIRFWTTPRTSTGEFVYIAPRMGGLLGIKLIASSSPDPDDSNAKVRRLNGGIPWRFHLSARSPDHRFFVFSDKDRDKMRGATYYSVDGETGRKDLFLRDTGARDYGEILWWE